MSTMQAPKYRVLAVNDDRDFCECCGKTGLKRVVFIEAIESGEIKHFGTTCAMAPSKGFGLDKEIKTAIKRADEKRKVAHHIARAEYRKAGGTFLPYNHETGVWALADRPLYDSIFARVFSEARFNY